ncbi:hypothetical protein ACJX0J_020126, partial [Zea mays]
IVFCMHQFVLSKYGGTKYARAIMLVELKKLIEAYPCYTLQHFVFYPVAWILTCVDNKDKRI